MKIDFARLSENRADAEVFLDLCDRYGVVLISSIPARTPRCENCDAPFQPAKIWQRFCGPKCYGVAGRRRRATRNRLRAPGQ